MSEQYVQDVRELAGLDPADGRELLVRDGEVLDQPTLVDLRETIVREHAAAEASLGEAVRHALLAGEALTAAKAALPTGRWQEWMTANLDFCSATANNYMRLAAFRDELPEGVSGINQAIRHLRERGLHQSLGLPPSNAAAREEAIRLRAEGLSYTEIARRVGFAKATVQQWFDPSHKRRSIDRQRERRARDRAARDALRRQEQDKAVKATPFSAVYAEIHALTKSVDSFADNAATAEYRAIANAALAKLHEARDEIVRGLGIS